MSARFPWPRVPRWQAQTSWRNYWKGTLDTEQQESLLGDTKEAVPTPSSQKFSWFNYGIILRLSAAIGLTVVAIIFWAPSIPEIVLPHDDGTHASQYLHIVIPEVALPDSNLCKTVLTAQVLNYPIPTILIEEEAGTISSDTAPERSRARLSQAYKWLESQPLNADHNIVIMLDGPRSWFQLRPEVLLRRYYGLIHRATRKLGQNFHTSIVFAGQKDCVLRGQDDPMCLAASRSPMAQGFESLYLGGGAMIGPVVDLRALFQRALEMSGDNPSLGPLELFNQIFGEQEVQREAVRQGRSWRETWHKALPDFSREQSQSETPVEPEASIKYDFGIALDYEGELGVAAAHGEDSARWAQSNSLPVEVEESMQPFWTVSGGEPDLPKDHGWRNVDLFQPSDSGVAPAMIHLPDESKDVTTSLLSEELWPKHWIQPHARSLYTAAQRLPPSVIAQVQDDRGKERIFWNKMLKGSRDKAGAWLANGTWQYWEDLCSADQQWREIFRDDKGSWRRTDW